MSTTRSHRDLVAWQEAMNLVEMVCQQTAGFPKEETYVLTAQTHRAAISVPSNMAEGAARNFERELYRYLGIAMGSLAELETQLELAIRLKYLPREAGGIQSSTAGWQTGEWASKFMRGMDCPRLARGTPYQ